MKNNSTMRIIFIWMGCYFSFASLSSCEDKLMETMIIFSDDFSHSDQQSLVFNAKWHEFNGDTVLGWYNNEEIGLKLSNLPKHNTVEITIDLLVHDSWDGNPDNVGGPDYWYMHLDGEEIIKTTFSNTPCGSNYCLYQSYPDNYPRTFEPRTGALNIDLPGRCQYNNTPGWTSHYRITRLIKHSGNQLSLLIGDRLKQENASDPGCDESWSISKIEISALIVE